MTNITNIKYSLQDISIIPAVTSKISSRSECNPFNQAGTLPLFTAPMSSVVDESSFGEYETNKIIPIIPRTVSLEIRKQYILNGKWVALSLDEFEKFVQNSDIINFDACNKYQILVDIANGHIERLAHLVRESKSKFGDKLVLMVGNVANPKTYTELSLSGADYVRIGIGGGFGCITTTQTGIHYPMASLIIECYQESEKLMRPAYIVADGGMRNYSDIIKALALGADYVMCGSIFSKMLGSAGNIYVGDQIVDKELLTKNDIINQRNLRKKFYGMSTKKAQKELGADIFKTSEGTEKWVNIEYTTRQWCDNFIDYLKSAMSYTSAKCLNDFIGKAETCICSNSAIGVINK